MTKGNNRDHWNQRRKANRNSGGGTGAFRRQAGRPNSATPLNSDPSNRSRIKAARAETSYIDNVRKVQEDQNKRQIAQSLAEEAESDCINSSQCGSGYACVGGGCVKQEPTGQGSGSVAGDGCAPIVLPDFDFPIFPCGGSPDDYTPTCGNDNCYTTPPLGPGGEPGCGPDECCRYNEELDEVQCQAALCPPLPPDLPPLPPLPELPSPQPPDAPIPCSIGEEEEGAGEDCPPGLECNGLSCVPIGCSEDEDCPPGFECVNGVCLPAKCDDDEDCPEGQICVNGICVPEPPGCDDDDDCEEGFICVDGICVPGCRRDEDCPPGMICEDGICVPVPCIEDEDCPVCTVCEDNECVAYCPEGFTCTPEGECVPDPTGPAPDPAPTPPVPTPGVPDGDGLPGGPSTGPGGCSGYCDSYRKLFGEDSPTCGPMSACDECSECKDSGECGRPLLPSPNEPCWCKPGDCKYQNECKGCVVDPESPNYGDCDYDENCAACVRVYGTCCGDTVSASACASLKEFGDRASTQAMIWAYKKIDDCDKGCDGDPVEPCDCNCHNDCPDCQLCGSSGECYPDPACEEPERCQYVWTPQDVWTEGGLNDSVSSNSVEVPPAYSSGPQLVGDCDTCNPPHSYAYYKEKYVDCDGKWVELNTPTIIRGPLGTTPPFPTKWSRGACAGCCNGGDCP